MKSILLLSILTLFCSSTKVLDTTQAVQSFKELLDQISTHEHFMQSEYIKSSSQALNLVLSLQN